jgi:hypothetical protein
MCRTLGIPFLYKNGIYGFINNLGYALVKALKIGFGFAHSIRKRTLSGVGGLI